MLDKEHIRLMEVVNNAKTKEEHAKAELILHGYRHCLSMQGNLSWGEQEG